MDSQVFTTFDIKEFKALLNETVSDALKSELDKILNIPQDNQKQYLTRQETAEKLNISLPTLHLWTKSGLIKACRIGTRVRYTLQDIQSALTTTQ